ncbi:MAG: glycosyltransferase family 2 protein, partial [Caldimonas sp.]
MTLPAPSSCASSTQRPCTLPVAAGDSLRISVVIPTIRGPDLLCRCLAAVLAQDLDHRTYEVIVVDAGDGVASQTVVDSFGNRADAPVVRLVRLRQGHGAAAARNAGWRAGYGKVIAFTDDDTVPDADWLAHGERALVPGLIALCGRVSTAPRCEAASSTPGPDEALYRADGMAAPP